MDEKTGGIKALAGGALCVVGIILAIVGAFFVSVALGIFLGARNLGRAAIVLGVISIFVGLLIGQGVIPGSYDRSTNGYFRDSPASVDDGS